MSGTNPFRRRDKFEEGSGSLYQSQDGKSDRAQADVPVINTDVAKPAKKTVRIISPHSTSESENRVPYGLFSPPPQSISAAQSPPESADSSRDSSPVDPFEADSSDGGQTTTEDEDLRRNTLNNAGSLDDTSQAQVAIPLNAFPSALANRIERARPAGGAEKAETESKPHYSVEEFKQLLLTGRKTAIEPPNPHRLQSPQSHGDSSSNTDTSSISRQSIFEPLPGLQQDTPRTSHEVSPSDDERMLSLQPPYSRNETSKPSTPKSHYGNFTKENTPQAVTFQDPSQGMTFGGLAAGKSFPNSPRTPTDLNKPLPPPPPPGPLASHVIDTGMTSPRHGYGEEPNSPMKGRKPPPLPLARRQSQHRPTSLLSTSGTSSGTGETSPVEVHPSSVPANKAICPPGSKVPPPPPPRRPGPIRGLSESSSTSAISTIATPTSSSFTDDSMSNVSKQRPPVPPTRNHSVSSAKRPTKTASHSGSPNLPPAPPPRRRDSSQSGSERQRSGSTTSSVQSKDIIADLSTLQKEVDALRGKFRD